jgi:hypothetical protein
MQTHIAEFINRFINPYKLGIMKTYTVILDEIVNPSRDSELIKPETSTQFYHGIQADNEQEAILKAKDKTMRSIWESTCYEDC